MSDLQTNVVVGTDAITGQLNPQDNGTSFYPVLAFRATNLEGNHEGVVVQVTDANHVVVDTEAEGIMFATDGAGAYLCGINQVGDGDIRPEALKITLGEAVRFFDLTTLTLIPGAPQ